jgi:hypothetical protein
MRSLLVVLFITAATCPSASRAQQATEPASYAMREAQYGELIQLVRPPKPTGSIKEAYKKASSVKWSFPPDEAEIIQQLHDLCTGTVIDGLGEPGATAESVQESLRKLQGENSLVAWIERQSNVPSVAMAEINGLPVAIAAFSVLYGGYGIPRTNAAIQFLSKAGGVWEVRDEGGEFFDGAFFRTALLKAPTPNEAWLLAWGRIFGNTRGRLQARLYAFDGYSARVIWEVEGVQRGLLEVLSGEEIELRYHQPPPEGILIPPTEVVERWRVVPSGLQKVVE